MFSYHALCKLAMRKYVNNSCKLSELSDLSGKIELEFYGFGIFIQRINFALFVYWAQ